MAAAAPAAAAAAAASMSWLCGRRLTMALVAVFFCSPPSRPRAARQRTRTLCAPSCAAAAAAATVGTSAVGEQQPGRAAACASDCYEARGTTTCGGTCCCSLVLFLFLPLHFVSILVVGRARDAARSHQGRFHCVPSAIISIHHDAATIGIEAVLYRSGCSMG